MILTRSTHQVDTKRLVTESFYFHNRMKKLFIAFFISFIFIKANAQWMHQSSGTSADLWSVYFTDSSRGYATGINLVLKTNNGGKTWTDCSPGFISYQYYTIFFIDSLTGYVGGFDSSQSLPGNYYPVILKTINGGKDWVNVTNNLSIGFVRSLLFIDADMGYAAGGYSGGPFPSCRILKTTDSGTNWIGQIVDSCRVGLSAVFFADSLTGYAVGERGTILKTVKEEATFINETSTQNVSFKVYPNPADGIITVESSRTTGERYLTVLTIEGQVFIQKKLTENTNQVDINLLPAGAYIIKLTDNYTTTVKILLKLHQF